MSTTRRRYASLRETPRRTAPSAADESVQIRNRTGPIKLSRPGKTPNTCTRASLSAVSSASHDDMVMQCCRRDTATIAEHASMITKPVVERVVDQLESMYSFGLLSAGSWAEKLHPRLAERPR